MLLVLNYVLRLWGGIARDRRDLVLEHIALRHQVDVLTRTRRRPALLLGDRPPLVVTVTDVAGLAEAPRDRPAPTPSCAGTVPGGGATGAGAAVLVGEAARGSTRPSPSRFNG